MNRKLNPSETKFKSIRKTPNGNVIIVCESIREVNNLKNKINQDLAAKYEAVDYDLKYPKIKILGVEKTIGADKDTICEQLRKQNRSLRYSKLDLFKIVNCHNDKDKVNLILEIDGDSFNKVIQDGKVNIYWNQYNVGQHISVIRCYNCFGFNHMKETCTNSRACANCGNDHDTNECDSEIKCCTNCSHANEKFNLQIDTAHDVWSSKCTIYKKKIEQASKRINYTPNQ